MLSHTTYVSSSSAGAMNNQISHISDQVGRQSEVKEHVNGGKDHLPCVFGVQVSVADGREGGDRPVHGSHISVPQASLEEVGHGSPDPGSAGIMIPCGEQIIEAASTVNSK